MRRPPELSSQQLSDLLNPQENYVYGEGYESQTLHHDLPVAPKTLRRQMTHRMHARRFKKA